MKKNEDSNIKKINRRDFLYKLGLSTTISIAGYYIIDYFSEYEQINDSKTSDKPLLKEDIKTYYENNELFLTLNNTKYCVNETGAEVVRFLDGNHTVYDISTKISGLFNVEHTEMLDSSIAGFICQLASTGFLCLPFYVTLIENYE